MLSAKTALIVEDLFESVMSGADYFVNLYNLGGNTGVIITRPIVIWGGFSFFITKGDETMETKIIEIAERIKGLREMLDISEEVMAEHTNVSVEEYRDYEKGVKDYSFTFLYACANAFGVDIVELLTGEKPRLSFYTVVRAGKGLPIKRRKSFTYQHLAFRMKDKLAEPFVVNAPYQEEENCNQKIIFSQVPQHILHTFIWFGIIICMQIVMFAKKSMYLVNKGIIISLMFW